MGSLWRLIAILICVVFGLLDASYGYPIGDVEGNYDLHGNWLTFWPCLLSAAVFFVATAAIGCCLCCRNNQNGFKNIVYTTGFASVLASSDEDVRRQLKMQANRQNQLCIKYSEFTDSGSSHSLSTGGYTNPAAASSPPNEFTIFPPPPLSESYSGGLISFEPLPDITGGGALLSHNQATHLLKKPAAFNTHGLSAKDWFDDPHANYPRSHLKYISEFGKGWFGRVVEGEIFDLSDQNSNRVVVKILHGDATPTDQMYFLHEVRYLRELTPHPNILALLGRCLETDPFLIILEGSPNGDLKSYLKRNADAMRGQGAHLRMACNVAQGLLFMHEKGFVHTDLAARNCMVDGNLTVKIGDYGTSTENFKEDYYWASDFALPIRWCAPETLHCTDSAILTKEVTASANIWSFGILLWEICEFGRLPFPDLNDEEVILKVLGERSCLPEFPTNSCLQANNLYHLMQLCWRADERWRPCASQVATILDYIYQHPTEEAYDSLEDFEHQWLPAGDDYKEFLVESNVYSPPLQNDVGSNKSCCIEELPMKIKSPSLQNLHGSLEDICTSPPEKIHSFPLLESKEKCWLYNEKMHDERGDDDDAQFVQKISEVIRDLDDVLALEKTSSSGSGTSPDECSPKKRFLQESHNKIDENGVLDFRLDEEKDFFVDGSQSITINSTKLCNINGRKIDSSFLREEQGENDKELETLRGEDVVWKNKWEAGRSDEEEEEDDEDWLQQVERGELSAKVKEKCRSVQDLMVLTHIEESSEGSDSESSNNKGSVQPAPCSIHSFGSVGDLRSVVLGEELRHTLERLSAINKRRDADIPSEDYLQNSQDKCEKNGKIFELPKKPENFFSSSHLTENVSTAVTPSNIESTTDDEQPSDRSVAMLHFSEKENVCIEDADTVERKKVTCAADSIECSIPFTNKGENFRVQSSTPLGEINERIDSPSEDSLNFIASDSNTSHIVDKIGSLSPSNCKFSHSGVTVLEGASSEINSCGRSIVYDNCATTRNQTDCYLETEREIPLQNSHKDLDSFSYLSSGKVESLSNLAKHCLSVSHNLQLSSDRMNCLDDCISSDFLGGKSEDSCMVVLQEEESSDLLNSECLCMQESPVSEFPGEERNVGMSCGISGSQSTVECTSPLPLSPVDCCQIYKAPVISYLTITNPSSELEKLKSDSITKEMDADFIFSVDAEVKKKNSLIQPDFLSNMKLDRESDTSLKSVSDQKGIVGVGMMEVDLNCEENYGKSVDNDFERSHLLLDLVPISSNGLQEYSSEVPSLVVAAFPLPNAERGDFHILPSETPAEKCIEKELVQSDAPNSEECDSADTEDSVFDFSPSERKSEGRVKKEEVTRGEGEEDVEGLLNLKQWTPDDERSSDSGFREKGSLSESIEDERCELEIGTEEEKEVTSDSCNCLGEKASMDENEQSHTFDKHSVSSEISPEKGKCEEFWKWQLSSLRQAVGETASLVREASSDGSGWVKGEDWDEHSSSRDSTESRGLDEASLAALRSELEEKLGASNGHFALDQEIERTNSEEQLSDEEYEERTDITIHYDAYLAQLSPILEERESVGSSELCSPAAKEVLCNSISEDSATTASVSYVTDNQVFSSGSNVKDPDVVVEEILILDTETNQSSLRAISPIDFHENDASSPEFTDSLEEDDTDKMGKKVGNQDVNSPQKHCEKDDYQPQPANSLINDKIPFWSLQPKPLKGLPLLVPPPASSAPMPSPEEEKASCVDRVTANPMFRDFEDIVALCQKQEEERGDVQPFWESESSDGNDSSSSGEFVWKEGERNAASGSDLLPSVPLVYESEFAMAVIEEEDEDTDNDSLLEFVPSAWNCTAEPSRSSLRSPDRKSDQKKNVSFKRQKYQCVYEYPKEEGSDSDGDVPVKQMNAPLDYSTYADWELMEGDIPAETVGEADLDSAEETNNLPTQPPFDFYKLSSEDFDFGCEGDFMVSSSSRPFELCSQSDVGFPSLPLPGWVNEQDAPIGESVPDLLMDTMSKTKCYKEKKEQSNWSSPSASPPSSSGLGELRHTRDRLKLDLSHKLVVNEGKGEGKEEVRRREEERGEASVLDVDKETKTAL